MTSLLHTGISGRTAARIAGYSLVLMALLAGFAFGYAFNTLVIPGNAEATFNNINHAPGLFRACIGGFFGVLLLDILTAWALNLLLKPVHAGLSQLAAILRLLYAGILGTALCFLLPVTQLAASGTADAEAIRLTEHAIQNFMSCWSMGLIVFGLHLVVLGMVVYRAGFIHKTWGILLFIAGLCYFSSNLLDLLVPAYHAHKATVEAVMTLPMIVAELGFALWLLIRNKKIPA